MTTAPSEPQSRPSGIDAHRVRVIEQLPADMPPKQRFALLLFMHSVDAEGFGIWSDMVIAGMIEQPPAVVVQIRKKLKQLGIIERVSAGFYRINPKLWTLNNA